MIDVAVCMQVIVAVCTQVKIQSDHDVNHHAFSLLQYGDVAGYIQ